MNKTMIQTQNKVKFLITIILVTVIQIYLFSKYEYHWLKIIRYISLSWFLILSGVIDWKQRIIPNNIIVAMLLVRMVLLMIESIIFPEYGIDLFITAGIGFIGMGGIFFIIHFINRNGLGAGDVKLVAGLGAYLGLMIALSAVFMASIFMACYGGVMVIRKKMTLKDSFPMTPFLALGTIIVLIFGV